ncbi:KpsF/GutQ family sugar-phosphate isomerase [Dasania sp. GY-MA-18]|uniref:Arabinose 5-phosphate isomerase n=1 Tax=Dasania phycosphaerae TaxID=2950436 RepID=A0A9J6RIA1_9GAMM|nr:MULTISPECIES: KpsF/GutQ family sugar-phosphate isomerase [Dasania]MCR8921564.1 KpsF/GutQ family sugar-phosphate isomerase [Dasania sp. GY-MA-18]MCZ0863992.1 KpsF/GutQ family sugar-phosphate isomerase [Dasania phycosphaerae]MCZ0867720.1 KpsF/GutQ family sugar-phosphate isomerase [Dasania phycosphaerae]
MTTISFKDSALRTINIERDAVASLIDKVDKQFDLACQLILQCQGRVVVTGMGKSGHIGTKIAATLASTGTPAMFVHPGEASHGDMGMITAQDVVIALSNSGSTAEVVTLLPLLKRLGIALITITGNPDSILSQTADANLDVSVAQEACPLNLAPTSSTTASLVMGDALAIALLEARGFTAEDFAFSHPGGALGRQLLLKVDDVMHSGEQIPKVASGTLLSDALLEVSRKGLGMTTVVDKNNVLIGLFTDGDLRRALDHSIDIHNTRIDEVMTVNSKTAHPGMLAAEILGLMDEYKINSMAVVDSDKHPVGAVHLHDLLKAGVA